MRKNKRYSIVIKTGVETRILKKYSKEEIINLISKYNSDIKNKYFLGDINFNYKEYIVTFNKYLKVSMPSTLEEIDHTTLGFITILVKSFELVKVPLEFSNLPTQIPFNSVEPKVNAGWVNHSPLLEPVDLAVAESSKTMLIA